MIFAVYVLGVISGALLMYVYLSDNDNPPKSTREELEDELLQEVFTEEDYSSSKFTIVNLN